MILQLQVHSAGSLLFSVLLFKENQIHQRIAELRKEGLWSPRRLPKLQEAPRPKSHWDYLLEEMQWMATDFAQERKWKMATAKKVLEKHFFSSEQSMLMSLSLLAKLLRYLLLQIEVME